MASTIAELKITINAEVVQEAFVQGLLSEIEFLSKQLLEVNEENARLNKELDRLIRRIIDLTKNT